ncbi:MAG: alpha/beta hydrolase-fold protein [Planctomycetota bacterium]
MLSRSQPALLASVLLLGGVSDAQSPPDPDYVRTPVYDTYQDFWAAVDAATSIPAAAERAAAVSDLWHTLTDAGQVPFAIDDRVAFLYRGGASSVSWRGDFNRWGEARGRRLGQSDLWIYETAFPADARTDYKVFLNGSDWRLDPSNPLQMWGGFGPNSELRMPSYAYPHETIRRPGVARGTLSNNVRMATDRLPHDVNYRVYTPAGYGASENGLGALTDLPTVYVTDGHEYTAEHMGSMTAALDNLIADGKLAPTIAVFIDPRDPVSGSNRRQELYVANESFADFVADDLMPAIDAAYRTDARPESRTILGTSLGGFFSGYLGAVRPDAVRNLALQSPALGGSLPRILRQAPPLGQNIVMTGGTFGDDATPDLIAATLTDLDIDFEYTKVNDGHSWGAWRGQLGELLLATIGPPVPEPAAAAAVITASGVAAAVGRRGPRAAVTAR